MHSDRARWRRTLSFALVFASLAGSSCGVLGQKEDVQSRIDFKGKACMNQLKTRIESYIKGDISEEDWGGVFDCTLDSLNTFQKFIDTGNPAGFTREDLRLLVSRFLVTDREVTDDLMSSLLSLKASLAGGDSEIVTFEQIEFLKTVLKQFKTDSMTLIPLLKARDRYPTPENMMALADAVKELGDKFAGMVSNGSNRDFPRSEAEKLVRELERMGVATIDPEFLQIGFAAKRLLFAGSSDAIEGEIWGDVIRMGASAYGLFLGIKAVGIDAVPVTADSDRLDFRDQVAARVYDIVSSAVTNHKQVIPFDAIDSLIEALPDSMLTITTKDGDGHVVDKQVVQRALRPFAKRLLGSEPDDGISAESVDLVYDIFLKWSAGDRHIQRIFAQKGLKLAGVVRQEFRTAAATYQAGLTDDQAAIVTRIVREVDNYQPLFGYEDSQIMFQASNLYSITHMRQIYWINLVAQQLLAAYGNPEFNMAKAKESDLERLVGDFMDIGNEMRVLDKTIPDQAQKRFVEADMFTPVSNGDGALDETEITYYIAYLMSAGAMATYTRDHVGSQCAAPGSDALQWRNIHGECFIEKFFAEYEQVWSHFPNMWNYFRSAPKEEQEAIKLNMVKAARRFPKSPTGDDSQWVASYDTQAFGAVLHYVESLFTRFDKYGIDQKLTLNELGLDRDKEPNGAYALLRPIIAKKGCIDANNPKKEQLLKTAFTYIVNYGEMPPQIVKKSGFPGFVWPKKNEIKPLLRLAAWYVKGLGVNADSKLWNIQSSRAKVYSVIPLVAGGDSADVKPCSKNNSRFYDPGEDGFFPEEMAF